MRSLPHAQSFVVRLTISSVLHWMQCVRLPSLRPKRRALFDPQLHLPPQASSGFLLRERLTMPGCLQSMQFVRALFFFPLSSVLGALGNPKRFTLSLPHVQRPVDGRRFTRTLPVFAISSSLHSTQFVACSPATP